MIGMKTLSAKEEELPARHDAQRAVGPSHVPVRLGAGGDLGRVVGAVLPDRVDAEQAAHQRGDAEDDEEEATGLGGVHGEHREADDVLLGAAGSGPLGVLVVDEQQHVGPDERQQDARDQQHVDGVEPRDDLLARELAAEEEEAHVGAHDRHRLHEAVRGADTGAGEQVVGQRVAGEALEGAEEQQQRADDPVELTRLAVGAGEVDAQQVDHHRGDEGHRGPVVHLPHEQSTAHVEGDVDRRGHRVGHQHAAQRVVGAVVDDLGHARVVPECEEHAGQEQDHEAPQGDLAQHEGPVVREDLAQVLLHRGAQAQALVGPVGHRPALAGLLRGGGRAVARGHLAGVDAHRSASPWSPMSLWSRSQYVGPTGSVKSDWATR